MPTAFHMLCERKDATVGLVKALGRGAHQAAMVQDAVSIELYADLDPAACCSVITP